MRMQRRAEGPAHRDSQKAGEDRGRALGCWMLPGVVGGCPEGIQRDGKRLLRTDNWGWEVTDKLILVSP